MPTREYRFKIDAFKPATLPMKRFAEYVGDLASLLGDENDVHFDRIEAGSVEAVALVNEPAQARVAGRLSSIARGDASLEVMKLFTEIDNRLAADNAIGEITNGDGKQVIQFPGRNRPSPVLYPAFTEPTTLQGQLISLAGGDETKHAQLIDRGVKFTGLYTRNTDLLERLKVHLWGAPVRLIGRGRYQRAEHGKWELKSFQIDDFEPLRDLSLTEAISELRSIGGLRVDEVVLREVTNRYEDEQ